MEIKKEQNGAALSLALTGRLDTVTAPELEAEIRALPADVTELNFDFKELEYISSAGLRVLLAAQKEMNTKGKMVIKNVSDSIMEIFTITGFTDILTIE